MLLRPQAWSGPLSVGFVACAWLVLCLCFLVQQLPFWTVSSTPGMCVLPSPSASLGGFFALPAQPKWLFA